VVADGIAYVQAGAGVVADSKPEREFEETLEKAGAMFKAIEMAESM
jgi:anthranilate/para-aminobenzoate synthase component I